MTTTRLKRNRLLLAGVIVALVVLVVALWVGLRGDDSGTGPGAPGGTSPSGPAVSSAPTAQTPGQPTTGPTVPAPRPGTPTAIGSGAPESVQPVKTKKPVALDDPADFGTGLSVRLSGIKSVDAEAKVPGEVAGPALRMTVVARNRSAKAIGVDRVVVFVSYGKDRTPASGLSDGSKPLTKSVPAGASRTGTYLFAVPKDQRRVVRVEVSYSGKAPTVAFEGPVEN